MSREVHVQFWERVGVRFPCATHLPLYRQERIYRERYGVKLVRQSMLGWVHQAAQWLKPIYNYMIGPLYCQKRYLREHRAGPKLRQARRQSHSAMSLERLRKALPVLKRRALPRSKLGEAVDYALNQWPTLCRYLEYGRVEIGKTILATIAKKMPKHAK